MEEILIHSGNILCSKFVKLISLHYAHLNIVLAPSQGFGFGPLRGEAMQKEGRSWDLPKNLKPIRNNIKKPIGPILKIGCDLPYHCILEKNQKKVTSETNNLCLQKWNVCLNFNMGK